MQSVWRDARKSGVHAGALLLILALAMCMPAACSDIRAVPCTVGAPGETGECAIVFDQVSPGLSEFEVQVTLMDHAIGEIIGVSFPSWAGLNSKSGVPSDSVTIKAVDTGKKVNSGDREVVLATLIMRGDAVGTCGVQVKVKGVKDEGGVLYPLPGRNGTLVVLGPVDLSGDPMPDENAPGPTFPAGNDPIPTLPPVNNGPGTQEIIFVPTPVPTPVPTQIPTLIQTPIQIQIQTPVPTTVQTTLQTPIPTPIQTPVPTLPADPGQDTPGVNDGEDETANMGTPVMKENRGSLCIDSVPPGALVRLDGLESGSTPLCLDLEEGTYEIHLSTHEGYAWQGEITVMAGQTLSLPPFILKKPPSVYVISAEAGSHGSVYPYGDVKVREGEGAEFFFTAERGYRLDGVQVDGVWQELSSPVRFESVSADHALYGTFSLIPLPEANFSANMTEGYTPLEVAFWDLSAGDISARLWHFGDGTSSSEPSPVHVYEGAGTYTVSLDVCGEGGCAICRREGFITVREMDRLNANFSADNTFGPAPLMVQFQDLSTGSPDAWVWDFGDGNLSTEPSPVHVYVQPGMYSVLLTVSNDQYISMAEKESYVNVSPGVIGGSVGYYLILCPVDGARVFLDGQLAGYIRNGTLTIPVYVTATPSRFIHVIAEGWLSYSAPIEAYPQEDEIVTMNISLTSTRAAGIGPGRFQIPGYRENSSYTIPSLMKEGR